MIRFRCVEDEQRYNELRSQIYLRLARGLPPALVSEVLRNIGKLETLLHLEGLRQGVASQALYQLSLEAEKPLCQPLKAFQLHSTVYGSSDTPLRTVELEWLARLLREETALADSALDPKPMRFAPTTLGEVTGERRVYQEEDIIGHQERVPPAAASADDDEKLLTDLLAESEESTESPELLDRIRSTLQEAVAGGWRPTTWPELILGLQQRLQMDAFFLDLQLSSEMGRTVLTQCGLLDIRPGATVSLGDFASSANEDQAVASPEGERSSA